MFACRPMIYMPPVSLASHSCKMTKTACWQPHKHWISVMCSSRANDAKHMHCLVHHLLWEMYNCPIPDGYVIDHIINNKTDNQLKNLQLTTPQQNSQKYHHDYYHNKLASGKSRPSISVTIRYHT